jgi:hypothetical protein
VELVLGMVVLPGDRTPLQRRTMGLDTAILGDLVQVILDFAPT